MGVVLGLALASVSAAVSQVGFLLRERGAHQAADVDVRHPLRTAVDLFRQKWWTVGYLLAAVAYAFHAGALSLAPLSLVQAVVAGGLVVLAVVAERWFGFAVGRRQWAGVLLAAGGLALLAVTGGSAPSGQESAEYSLAALIAFEAGLVVLGTALVVCCRHERWRPQLGVALGLLAGLLFTVTHVAVKAASGRLDGALHDAVLAPYLPIAIAGGVVAFFASARSLQLGPALPVMAVTSIAGPASSIPAGIVVFGDPLGSDALEVVVRSLAFVAVVGASLLIPAPTRATRGEPAAAAGARPAAA